jgi:hypothetical protein
MPELLKLGLGTFVTRETLWPAGAAGLLAVEQWGECWLLPAGCWLLLVVVPPPLCLVRCCLLLCLLVLCGI